MLRQVILDLGRLPEARFLGDGAGEFLRLEEVKFYYKVCFVKFLGHLNAAWSKDLSNELSSIL